MRATVQMMIRVLSILAAFVLAPVLATSAQDAQELPIDDTPLRIETEEGTFAYRVELALDGRQRAVGLMNRESMAEDRGMLFRFDTVRPVTMWMKNTLIPLDMVFIRQDGTVAGYHEDAEPLSETTIASPEPIRYVLELNAGEVDEIGLDEGDRIDHPLIEAGRQ